MKYVACTIYDNVAEAYHRPMFFRSQGEALRSFQRVVNDPESEFSKSPDDYVLVEVGSWDEETGMLEENSSPERFTVSGTSVYTPKLEVEK